MEPEHPQRLYLRRAREKAGLSLADACAIVDRLESSGEGGLTAVRNVAVGGGYLTEQQAYKVYQRVEAELRALESVPRRLGNYEVCELLGSGSMAVVYKARQVTMDRWVALKILPAHRQKDRVLCQRFMREVRASAKLHHPNVVSALDAGFDQGYFFLAMELIEGVSLKALVLDRGALEETEALKVVKAVAKGLDHVHKLGLIHRDVKPSNIMVSKQGQVKLMDLGLVRICDPQALSLTQCGRSVGTPHYMAPESALDSNKIDARSDLYSLGASFFFMITGRPPFDGNTPSAVLAQHVSRSIPDPRRFNPLLGEDCVRLLRWLLAKDRERRAQSGAQLASFVGTVLGRRSKAKAGIDGGSSLQLSALSSGMVERVRRRPVRRPVTRRPSSKAPFALGLAAAILLVGGLLFAVTQSQPGRSARPVAAAPAALRAPLDRAAPQVLEDDKQRSALAEAYDQDRRLYGGDLSASVVETPAAVIPASAAIVADDTEAAELGQRADERARRSQDSQEAKASAQRLARETQAHRLALTEAMTMLVAGKPAADAQARLSALAPTIVTPSIRQALERDISALGSLAELPALVGQRLRSRIGERVKIDLRRGGSLSGKLADADNAQLSLVVQGGALVQLPLERIGVDAMVVLAGGALGVNPPAITFRQGVWHVYTGDISRGRFLVVRAAGKGYAQAKTVLPRIEELAVDHELLAALRPKPKAVKPQPVTTQPAEPSLVRKTSATTLVTKRDLLKLFEVQPALLDERGLVRFDYAFVGKHKTVGNDYLVKGAAPRYDRSLGVLKLDSDGVIFHRVPFTESPRFEVELMFEALPGSGGFVELIARDDARNLLISAPFALALAGGGRQAGSPRPQALVQQQFSDHVVYKMSLTCRDDGLITVGLDDAVKAHLDGLGGSNWRFGLRWSKVNVQLRSLGIEGRIESDWLEAALRSR